MTNYNYKESLRRTALGLITHAQQKAARVPGV